MLLRIQTYYTDKIAKMREELLEAEARDQQEAVGQAQEELKESKEREASLILQVRELRDSIQRQAEESSFREEMLRRDIEELERRYQAAEQRHEVRLDQDYVLCLQLF